jgi:hypothetical protein
MTYNGRWYLILKVKYLINHLLYHTQILNLSFDDQTIFYKYFKWRQPPMEDNLKILNMEYLSNNLLDHTQILNFRLDDKTIYTASNGRWPQTIISGGNQQSFCPRGNTKEIPEETSSVALLSPACFVFII